MKSKFYEKIGERLFTDILPNGLTVYYLPKADYNRTYGLFTTNFGSLDTSFVPLGESEFQTFPEGIAHFLEHKLFEKENEDAFARFGELGADANAFTNAYQTSYLFSTTQNLIPALTHLLDFVQTPYFSKQTVEKEQGIIGQEIQMYDDDPNWALYMGLLNTLYPDSSIAKDIAGTRETIATITPELLYAIHSAFYQPTQLTLHIVGHFNPEEILAVVKDNQFKKDLRQPHRC